MDKPEGAADCFRMRIIEYHDYKTLMGPCFVSFSIPLLIPGVVLTIVGSYGNEHTFSRFGGWHVTGIVILSIAIILLVAGIILKCCYRPVMSADIEQHLSPNPSLITGSRNLGRDKDLDENDSTGSKKGNGNKVSPSHYPGKHEVVSTHDKRHKTDSEQHAEANGALSLGKKEQKTHTKAHTKTLNPDKKSTTKRRSSDTPEIGNDNALPIKHDIHRPKQGQTVIDSDIEYTDRTPRDVKPEIDRPPPPAYAEVAKETTKPNTSLSTNAHERKAISNAIATSADVTGATSQHSGGLSPRDNSSDANESARFLPDIKKKRKKKRVKRRRSDKSDNGEGPDDETHSELPELRLRPVLLHEGESPHHPVQHVHFVSDKERSGESEQGSSALAIGEGVDCPVSEVSHVTEVEYEHRVDTAPARHESGPV